MSNEVLEVPLLGKEQQQKGTDVENQENHQQQQHYCTQSRRMGRNRQLLSSDEQTPYMLSQLFGKGQFKSRERDQLEYYERQKATIAIYEEVEKLHSQGQVAVDGSNERKRGETIAVNASNIANIILLVLKVYACVSSQSLAIIASTLDSLLDLLAGAILWFSRVSMRKFNIYEYPIGKSRVQPVGIICFAAVMASLGLQVLLGAVQELINGDKSEKVLTSSQLVWLCSIMGIAVVIKMALFLYCRRFENAIVQAYSKDHYFDVLTNIGGLVAALLAVRYFWWIDPIGAIALALYTIINWSQTVLETAVSLIGKAAPQEMIQKLTYLTLTHSDKIQHIDTVRAYTFGSYYFVEVDIELSEDMMLKEAHQIGESLQNKIERLPEVERAFVHLDFECEHKPEHSEVVQSNCDN